MENENRLYRISIKYDGDKHNIDAMTYLTSLISLTSVLQQLNSEMNKESASQQKLDILINANREGSFVVDLSLTAQPIRDVLAVLFSSSAINYCSNLVKLLTGMIDIRRFLKGQKPTAIEETADSDGKIKITDNNGNIYITEKATFNIYARNATARETIGKAFTALASDDSVNGIAITDSSENKLLEVKSEEFEAMLPEVIIDQPDRQPQIVIDRSARLNIVKLGFEESYKWDFYYNGNKVPARVADKSFYDLIDKGERFAKGDTLFAELEINQEYDKAVNTFINKSYTVKKIIRHIPRAQQMNFLGEPFMNEHNNVSEKDDMALLDEWIQDNQLRINDAMCKALLRVDGVSNALTDPDATGREAIRQKVEGLINAGKSILPRYVGEAFAEEFRDTTVDLRDTLEKVSESIVRENMPNYIDILIQTHGPKMIS